jgi:hypothetical protein
MDCGATGAGRASGCSVLISSEYSLGAIDSDDSNGASYNLISDTFSVSSSCGSSGHACNAREDMG